MDRGLAYKETAKDIHPHLSPPLQWAMDLNSELSSSSWLRVLPLQDQGFHLESSETLYICIMDGSWLIHLVTVFVGHLLALIMLWYVNMVVSCLSATMRYVIFLQSVSIKCVMMLPLNHHCNPFLERQLFQWLEIDRMKPVLISMPKDFGVTSGCLFWN